MEKYKLFINRDSIKLNPNRGNTISKILANRVIEFECTILPDGFIDGENIFINETQYDVAGKIPIKYKGFIVDPTILEIVKSDALNNLVVNISNDFQEFYHAPVPKYSYSYKHIIVECKNCKAQINSKDLKSDSVEYLDDEGDEFYSSSNEICPVCGEWDCCEIELESINDIESEIELS